VAIVGSGPAGLAAAQQLARAGHSVVVFEKDDKIGGLLRYGIPDFKLEKMVIDRRIAQLQAEGVEFQTNVLVGEDVSARYLRDRFDAVCLTMGAGEPRDLPVEGRQYANVALAMDYLTQQNRICAGVDIEPSRHISAQDKIVAVIGGGDTGSDCIGTAQRQGAKEIHQLEILPQPPEQRRPDNPWPQWPQILRTSSSQKEGCRRHWSVMTNKLSGQNGLVTDLHGVKVEWKKGPNGWEMKEISGSDFSMKADLVLLAMGFVHVAHGGLVEKLGVKLDDHGNVIVDANHMTSEAGVFAAGDTVRGASLVVWAIQKGREAAATIDNWMKKL
jgi:glutamate synthase (NADPH/NADH) small chain